MKVGVFFFASLFGAVVIQGCGDDDKTGKDAKAAAAGKTGAKPDAEAAAAGKKAKLIEVGMSSQLEVDATAGLKAELEQLKEENAALKKEVAELRHGQHAHVDDG